MPSFCRVAISKLKLSQQSQLNQPGLWPHQGVPMKETILDITLAIVLGLTFAAFALEWFDVLTY